MRRVQLLLAAAWLLTVPTPAAANEFDLQPVQAAVDRGDYDTGRALLQARLRDAPDDTTSRFMLARVHVRAGDYPQALREYEWLLGRHPDDVDYVFGRALALNAAGDSDAALRELARARRLAPDYEDVWRVEHSVLLANDVRGDRYAGFRREAERRFADADWLTEPPAAERATTQISFGAMRESLSRPVPDWTSLFVEVRRQQPSGGAVYGRAQSEERFGRRDVLAGGGAEWVVTERWRAGFDALAGGSDFMPGWSVTGWAALPLANGWETRVSVRHRHYDDTYVSSTAGTVARYMGRFRAAYTLDLARLRGDSLSAAHVGSLIYFASDRTRFDLTLAHGEEAEAVATDVVLRTDVRSITVGMRRQLSERWQLATWIGTHRQGDLYTRRYAGFSLSAGL